MPCVHENRGDASVGARWAGRSASRGSKREEISPEKGRTCSQFSAGVIHRVVHSGTCRKRSEICQFDTLRPQLWRVVWICGKRCKWATFHPQFPLIVAL